MNCLGKFICSFDYLKSQLIVGEFLVGKFACGPIDTGHRFTQRKACSTKPRFLTNF